MGNRLISWILLIILAIIWGSSFILMKRGMYDSSGNELYTSNQVGVLRIFFASLFLAPIAIRSIRRITKRNFFHLLVVGLCGNFFPAFLFTYAETNLNHSLVGVLNSTTPIFTIILGVLFFRLKVTKWHIIGILISTLGLLGLLGIGADLSLSDSGKYIFAVLIATLCYATSLNMIKKYLADVPPIQLTSLAFFLVLLPSLIIGLFLIPNSQITWTPDYQRGLGYILILGIIGTSIAVILFNRLIQISSAIFASSVTYLIPIIALLWGFLDKEDVNLIQVISMLVIIGGVLLINRTPKKSKKNTQ